MGNRQQKTRGQGAEEGTGSHGAHKSCSLDLSSSNHKAVKWEVTREDSLSISNARSEWQLGVGEGLFYRDLETNIITHSGTQVFTWHPQGPPWDLSTEVPPCHTAR